MSDFQIVVPASTSNLGPGFDCVGLAVDRYLTLEWHDDGDGAIDATGLRPPKGFGDLLDTTLHGLGLPGGGALRVHSEIPVGRGLGSSAALRIALASLWRILAGEPLERGLLLEEVTADEGHPDNVAPALYGGLVVAVATEDGARVIPAPLSEKIAWTFAAPSAPASTDAMRAALPSKVPHGVAVRSVGRMAALLPALATGDGELLRWAMRDEIHVPYRLERITGARDAVDAALDAGAWGCTLSGAGSGLIAASPPDRRDDVLAAMGEVFRRVDQDPAAVVTLALQPASEGTRWKGSVSSA